MVDDSLDLGNAAASPDLPALARAALELLADDPAVERLGLSKAQLVSSSDARGALAALLTVRPPGPLPPDAVPVLDALLAAEREVRGVVDVRELPSIAAAHPGSRYPAGECTVLWEGDIRRLSADAVVNAANSALLGCFVPGHGCIDNAIHSAAGPRLRDDCEAIMEAQGSPEPVGSAKITRGYHLPARYVLHTVGPAVSGRPSPEDEAALARSYRACLDLAASIGDVRTVAFCSISTGVFGYPKEEAAPVALRTVAEWLDEHPDALDLVVFDVYGAADEAVYRGALGV